MRPGFPRRTRPRTTGSLLSGASGLAVSRYVVALLGWTGTVVIARELSATDWGAFSLIFSLLSIVGFLGDLQVSRIVLHELVDPEQDTGGTLGSYFVLRMVLGAVAYAVAVAIVLLGDYPTTIVLGTAVAGTTLVLASASHGLRLFFESRLWMRPVAVALVVGQAAQLALTLAIAATGHGSLVYFVVPAVLFDAVVLAWELVALRRVARIRLQINWGTWYSWLREAVPLALGWALAEIYFRIDMVMLSKLDSLASVGVYAVGYKFADLSGFFAPALLAPAMALLVRAWPHRPQEFHRVVRHALVVLAALAVGLVIGFAFVAQPAIELLYGSRFGDGAWAARGLVAGKAINFFTQVAFVTLVAAGWRRLFPVAMLIGLIVNVGLNLVLIPRFSYNGAAAATVVTELLVLAVLWVALTRVHQVWPLPWGALARIVLAGGLMASAMLAGRELLPWYLLATLGGVVYLAALHLLRVDGSGGLVAIVRNAPRLPEEPGPGKGDD
jgi:O-antigen/teichoic acid export membrane protein